MTRARLFFLAVAFLLPGAAGAQAAQGYIGEGIQGRPHGGAKAAVRAYNFRHGLGYTRHPMMKKKTMVR